MKSKAVVLTGIFSILTFLLTCSPTYAASQAVKPTKSTTPTEVQLYLGNLNKFIQTKEFRFKAANKIVAFGNNTKNWNYHDLYEDLPSNEREILSARYGITGPDDLFRNIGGLGLDYKFFVANLEKDKKTGKTMFVKFQSSKLTLARMVTQDDIVKNASGSILGAYVITLVPGLSTYTKKTGQMYSDINHKAPVVVFVDASNNVHSSYTGPIRLLSTGNGLEIIERVGPIGSTILSVGPTPITNPSTGSRSYSWNTKGDQILLTLKDSQGNVLVSKKMSQNPKILANFIEFTYDSPFRIGKEYSIEIRDPLDVVGLDISTTKPLVTVKFGY